MAATLLEWYASIGAKFLDLVGDYAGKEKFFIEGDSLLLECFSNPLLDLDPGFQLLHAVYLVEKYLYNLLKRECNFDVIFFDNHKDTCVPLSAGPTNHSRCLLARTIIIKHLREAAQHTTAAFNYFQSLEDPAFAEYLHSSACYFALCSDGATYKYKKSKTLNLQSHAVSDDIDNVDAKERRVELRSIIHLLLHKKGLDVALLNGLTLQDSKVFAFVLERSTKCGDLQLRLPLSYPHCFPGPKDQNVHMLEEILSQAREILSEAGLQPSARLMNTLIALHKQSPDYCGFIAPVLLHTVLLQSIKLSGRRVPAVSFNSAEEDKFQTFLNHFCCQANICVKLDLVSALYDSTLIDLVDGRLLRQALASYTLFDCLLPVKHHEAITKLTQLLCGFSPFC